VIFSGKSEWREGSYLQDVVVLESRCHRDFLRNNQGVLEVLIRNIVKLLSVVYRKRDESVSRVITETIEEQSAHFGITREWPRARGPMSKKEKLV
jgi:hypothetical protein